MDPRIQKLASVLVNYSVALKPGERLLIRAMSPDAEPLAQALYEEAFNAGGLPFVYIMMAQEDEIAVSSGASLEQLEAINPMLELMYKTCECVIRIDAPQNTRALSQYPAGRQRARAAYLSKLIGIQMVREADKTLRRCTTQYPTFGLAQNAGMSLRQYEDFLFSACKADQENPVALWEAVFESHKRLIDWLKGKKRLQVKGEHIDLEMSIEGRSFINAGGRHNMPDGEIFTGPVEDSVNGWVRFTYPGYYHGNEVKGVELRFENGLVVDATAQSNEGFLLSTLDTDPGARRLGEFAIGTNRDIQEFTGSILFDEKIGGTVHMAVGQGYGESGSVNQSSVHWDMICDMRAGGEIIVDGELFYKDGEFVI
ncbi:MAG TPA: aminopeptidase [Aggregatilineaceae bacterium]|jgi:aminopeptidase|nr:aminopeptidase [Anaerolineae bacterium]HMM28218.1 aminopeptidase [Aggregatilineaceae bacterium]